jgi:Ca2+-binding EF-hand superfamily protein
MGAFPQPLESSMKLLKPLAAAGLAGLLLAAPAFAKEDSGSPFMAQYDMDKDGMLSKQEVQRMMEQMFEKHDTKKMGKLDPKQFQIFLQELMKDEGAKPSMAKYDMDKDGMISKQEVMRMTEQMFEKHDTKKMGKLDSKQFELFLQELMKSGG